MDSIWNWAILGVILICLELVSGTFYIMCFGISAFLVTGLSGAIPLSLNGQLISFLIFSLITLSLWHFKYKGKKGDFSVGQSNDDTIGRVGEVSEISEASMITVKFTMPVMGSRTWMVLTEDHLEVGNAVKVVSIEGNYLKVEKK
jgi:membrane protein implicated in regulation of membrane protease activity